MGIFSLLGRVIVGIAATLGLAAVARKYTEPPPEGTPALTGQPATTATTATAVGPSAPLAAPGEAAGEPGASHQPSRRPGWSRPKPEVIPPPTYWPITFALGIAFLMWGFISNIFVFCLGVILIITAIVGWIGDLRHEFK